MTGRNPIPTPAATSTPLHGQPPAPEGLAHTARQLREHLAAILNDSNDAVFTCDPQGRILSWNKGAESAYGYGRDEASTLDFMQLAAPEAQALALKMVQQVLAFGTAGPGTILRRAKDGRIATVSVALSALRDPMGAVHAFVSTERDITEQLRTESEVRFRRLADDIPALLRVEDTEGHATFVNNACISFTGRPRDALMGRGWLEWVHPTDRQLFFDRQAAATALRSPLEIDIRMLRHDGVYRWVRSMSVPHVDVAGQFAGYVALMLDVEDRKRAEAELIASDQRKDEFLAMLAHELRNPLAPIRSAVTLLNNSTGLGHRAEWAIGVMDRQTQLVAKLLDSLLDVARISQGKLKLELAPLQASEMVARAVEISQPLITARRHHLAVDVAAGLVIQGDLVRLTQVFANLLNNAAKYTDEGGQLRLEVRQVGGQAVVRVQDNGCGLSAEMVPRVFELFSQADTTLDRSKGGLGVGLTLVRELVELHGGTVTAESPGLGLGSTFTVRLPLLAGEPAAAARPGSDAGARPAEARRVLVVDDNEEAAETLAAILDMDGHEVAVARNGQQALELAQARRPDVILLDIGLPDMDGYEVARRLRRTEATAGGLLVALTGYGQPKDIARAHEAGFDRHFVKPVDIDHLCALILATPRLGS